MAWNAESEEILRRLWPMGLSAAQIAARIGGGVTRNAVIGKRIRLGLPDRLPTRTGPRTGQYPLRRRPKPRKVNLSPEKLAIAKARDEFQPGPDLITPECERKTLQQLGEASCRWPYGDGAPADFRFCGKPKLAGLPYCPSHAARAFVTPTPRRRQPADEPAPVTTERQTEAA